MIDVKQAVQIAKEHALNMLGQKTTLEEIERQSYNNRDVWTITLGLPRDLEQLSPFARLGANPLTYKRFLIDSETGELVAMKLREIANQ